MKKSILLLLGIFFIIISTFVITMSNLKNSELKLKNSNEIYEQNLNKTILGSKVLTIINKAMDTNYKNNIAINEEKLFINNNKNSIHVYVKLEKKGKYFPMEKIVEHDINQFARNFSLMDFKCTKITYHSSTKLVEKVYFDII